MRIASQRQPFATNSIFFKLFLTLVLVTTPLYGLSLLLNQSGERSIRDGVLNSLHSQVEFYMTSLDTELSRLQQLATALVNDVNLSTLSIAASRLSDFERSETIKDLQRQLFLLRESSEYVKKVSAYIPLLDRAVTTVDLYETIREDEFQAMYRGSIEGGGALVHWRERLFLVVTYPTPALPNREEPMALLQIELDTARLARFLSQFVAYYDGGAAALAGDGWVVKGGQAALPGGLEDEAAPDGYFAVTRTSAAHGVDLDVFVPERHVLGYTEPYRLWFWLLSLASACVIIFFSYYAFLLVHRPMRKIVRAFHRVEEGDLSVAVHHRSKDEFTYLYEGFNTMVTRLRKLISEMYEQKIRVQRAELKHLQAQIQPHFLYNSFYILYRMARVNEQDNVIRFTKYLGDYFRFLYRGEGDTIPLGQEVEHARTYVEIQHFRFENRIRFTFDALPQEWRGVLVPRLILQPVIENAYQHGFDHVPEGGILAVRMKVTDGTLRITVEDNGPGLDPAQLEALRRRLNTSAASGDGEEQELSGIVNVHRRLRNHFGLGSGLEVEAAGPNGYRATLTIPGSTGAGRR